MVSEGKLSMTRPLPAGSDPIYNAFITRVGMLTLSLAEVKCG